MNDDTRLIIASLELLGQIAEPLLRDDEHVQKDVLDFIDALKQQAQEQNLLHTGSRLKGKMLCQQGLPLLRSLATKILRDNAQVQQAFISFLDTI